MNKRLTVYVAGAYSANNVMDVLHNMRKGIQWSTTVLKAGMAPFSPWLDYHYVLMDDTKTLSVNDFYEYSMEWLTRSDVMFVTPEFENSKGTLAEIQKAKELDIPIFYTFDELLKYFLSWKIKL
jgi:hypothetical protein